MELNKKLKRTPEVTIKQGERAVEIRDVAQNKHNGNILKNFDVKYHLFLFRRVDGGSKEKKKSYAKTANNKTGAPCPVPTHGLGFNTADFTGVNDLCCLYSLPHWTVDRACMDLMHLCKNVFKEFTTILTGYSQLKEKKYAKDAERNAASRVMTRENRDKEQELLAAWTLTISQRAQADLLVANMISPAGFTSNLKPMEYPCNFIDIYFII